MRRMQTSWLTAALALPTFAAPVLAAPVPQDPEPGQEPEKEFIPIPFSPAELDPQDELKKLFASVERRLREIDILLSDAGAGDIALEDPGASGIDDLLRRADNGSELVIQDIDRILEVASQMSSQSGGGGGQGQPQPGGPSPLDEQRGSQNRQRENTPETPQDGEQQEQQQEQQQQPNGQQHPEQEGSSDEDPFQRQGEPPPGGETGQPSSKGATGADWGDLPVRVREVFRSEGGGELPVQYRDWIDAYHRRLNRRRR